MKIGLLVLVNPDIQNLMQRNIDISKITLTFFVILLGLIIVGMIGAVDEDTGYTPSANLRIVRKDPFSLTGGTPPPIANGYASSPAKQQRIPSEGVWMQMEIESLSSEAIREMGLPRDQTGVIVDSVPPGSAAEKAGLRNGDIIKVINGQIIVNMADYIKATKNQKINSASLVIDRNGQALNVVIPPEVTGYAGQTEYPPGVNAAGSYVDRSYTGTRTSTPGTYDGKTIPPITRDANMPHPYWGVCKNCHTIVDGGSSINLPTNSQVGAVNQNNSGLPSPFEQNAAQKVLVEGHWLGMELIPITPELAQEYNLPAGVTGLLVDEVTLEAAESGLLAGDVLQSVNNYQVKTLEDFAQATRRVESLPAASLGVLRNGKPMEITLRSSWYKLGVAQNEAAQPIQPGAISPHKSRGRPCTDCHIIMKNGGQLQTDAGDILPVPPPLTRNATPPHSFRGLCNTCHSIIR